MSTLSAVLQLFSSNPVKGVDPLKAVYTAVLNCLVVRQSKELRASLPPVQSVLLWFLHLQKYSAIGELRNWVLGICHCCNCPVSRIVAGRFFALQPRSGIVSSDLRWIVLCKPGVITDNRDKKRGNKGPLFEFIYASVLLVFFILWSVRRFLSNIFWHLVFSFSLNEWSLQLDLCLAKLWKKPVYYCT